VEVTLDRPGVVAVYVDDRLAMQAVALFDIPFAAAAGAALAMLPVAVVDIATDSQALNDALAENVAEIMNVMTPLLAGPDSPHVRLHKVYQPDARLPVDIAVLASTLGRRVDLELSVAGYGNGELSIVFS
jgi:hypothetical protein